MLIKLKHGDFLGRGTHSISFVIWLQQNDFTYWIVAITGEGGGRGYSASPSFPYWIRYWKKPWYFFITDFRVFFLAWFFDPSWHDSLIHHEPKLYFKSQWCFYELAQRALCRISFNSTLKFVLCLKSSSRRFATSNTVHRFSFLNHGSNYIYRL